MNAFTRHINSVYPAIQFTVEREEEGKITMLGTLMHRKPDGIIKITVSSEALFHRADTCVPEDEDKTAEILNIRQSLKICGYKGWVFDTATPLTLTVCRMFNRITVTEEVWSFLM